MITQGNGKQQHSTPSHSKHLVCSGLETVGDTDEEKVESIAFVGLLVSLRNWNSTVEGERSVRVGISDVGGICTVGTS